MNEKLGPLELHKMKQLPIKYTIQLASLTSDYGNLLKQGVIIIIIHSSITHTINTELVPEY